MRECPKCASLQVVRLPPNQISPHPGYRCNACGIKMRSHGMLFVYLIALFLGLGVFVLGIFVMVDREDGNIQFRSIWLAGAGLVASGYSVLQIARPVPRNKTEFEREKSTEEKET